ncbi:LOW QUALITY PROTEIN: uncharacterized protein LOC133190214 [Saccostrea echinata]|uniref:LOW QUALITY PROTEIN: uncharacterized protein LOC133190214 n=1 Tax=Saccostrea echinata TaxID=191078 RepID=UPI002A7F21F4|nr:LOW QUALITY PROTEIN: uncharacterized protein LOC133190214 [Saccostrea echinata]
MTDKEENRRINHLKFPRYSGWLYKKENVFISTKLWCVLSHGYLHYYKDWRQNFYTEKIKLKGLQVEDRGWSWYSYRFTVGNLEFSASDHTQGNLWFSYMRNSSIDGTENIEVAVDSCRNLIVETHLRSDYPPLIIRLLGVMTISKDNTTSKTELFELSEYLCSKRFGYHLPNLYKLVFDELKIQCVTNEMLEQCSQDDHVDEGWMLLYLIRRLLWRFAFASNRFALQLAESCYINYLLSDLNHLSQTPLSEWNEGNYLLFSNLNCLQQCARTNRMKTAFYAANAHIIIGNIRQRSNSKKVKMATLLTLSHMLHEEDYHKLKIDEEFMTYFLNLIKKAVENRSHFVVICSNTGHLTEIREMFDAFSKVYLLKENQEVIDRINKEDLALHILHILERADIDEKLFALQMMKSICTSKIGKAILQDQYYNDLLHEVGILTKHHDLHLRKQADIVYEYLKKRGEWKNSSRNGAEMEALYLQALTEGSTLDRTIRVMFVGHKGAGKTTLCRRFLGENITSIRSTEGIDVYIEKFTVDLETRKWTIDIEDDLLENSRSKIAFGVKDFEDSKFQESDIISEPDALQSAGSNRQLADGVVEGMDGSSRFIADADDDITESERKEEIKPPEMEMTKLTENVSTDRSNSIHENMKINFEIEANVDFPQKFAHISMWDFAGEDVFYATHHVFLSPDAVFLVIIDLSNSETNNMDEIEKTRFWLRSILTYAKVKDTGVSCGFRLPPIIFVVTHKDKLPGESEEEKKDVALSYLAEVLNLSELRGIDPSFIRGRFIVDNTYLYYDPEIERLKNCIVESAKVQPNWEKEIPLQWVAVEREISVLKSRKIKLITVDKLKNHLKNCEVTLSTIQNLEGVLEHYHLKGFIIFFWGSKRLKKYVFIDPQWIVNAFKQLIRPPCAERKFDNEIIRRQWNLLYEEGTLTAEFAKEIFKLSGDDQLVAFADDILLSMEELNLIASMKPHWIVPSLLKRQIYTTLVQDFFDDQNISIQKTCAYCLKFREAFVPDPIMDKVIAGCISKWTNLYYLQGKPILYRGLVCLKVTESCNLMLYCKDNMIQAMLFSTNQSTDQSTNQTFGGVGNSVRLFLNDSLDDIFRTCYQESMKPIQYIQCKIMEPEDSMPVLADEIFQHDTRYCCGNKTLSPHPLTYQNLRQWWERVEKYVPHFQEIDVFSTPPESPDSVDFDAPKFPFLEEDKTMHGDNRFKRFVDSTLTVEVWENLHTLSQSVGCLHSPLLISTVFRVGTASVMSVAHHVMQITEIRGRNDFAPHDSNRLLADNVYVEFKGSRKEANKQFYIRGIQYLDPLKDVCVLELLVDDPSNLPTPFREFCLPTADSILTFIGFGHPGHNYKAFEPKVTVLHRSSKRVQNSVEWVQKHHVDLKNILQLNGKPVEWVDNAYSILDNEGMVGLNCFMQHGASGAPGITMTNRGLAVGVMLQGGLPRFFMDIGHYIDQIPLEQRIEYGITMDIIYRDLYQHVPDLCKDIFGTNYGF